MNNSESNLSKLSKLGLSDNQIEMVLRRISPNSIDLFIQKWQNEKNINMSNLNNNNPSNQFSLMNHISRNNTFDNIQRGYFESKKDPSHHSVNYNRQEQFNNNQNIPYIPRLVPNITDRISNEQMNQQYQEKTQARGDPQANLNILCVQLFGKEPDNGYSREYLDKKYRELAMTLHPDRGGNSNNFQMLVTCYKHLKGKILNKIDNSSNTSKSRDLPKASPPPDSLFDNKFDSHVFNKYYEKNSFKRESGGHGDWLKNTEEKPLPPRPSESNFNSAYEDHKKSMMNNLDLNRLQLIENPKVPSEVIHNTNTEILGHIDDENTDFTGQTTKGTKYTDIRRALETPHLIYSDNKFEEKDVSRSFANAKSQLGIQPQKMTQTEYEQYNDMKRLEIEAEERRRYNLSRYDEDLEHHFKQTNSNRLTM